MSTPEEIYQKLDVAAKAVKAQLASSPELITPRVMIICGSGLGGIASILKGTTVEVPYETIPGFRQSTVQGHAGKLVFGLIGENKVPVMCMVGRLHFYEGYELSDTTFPVRLAHVLGVSVVVVTNAAGGVNAEYKPGDLMIINDHINFPGCAGYHPLRGANLDMFGPRFQPLSDAYDLELRQIFFHQAKKVLKVERAIHEGVYTFLAGPTFESRAEVRMLRVLGADAVGMSTVPEVIIARHCGMRVLAMSLITNAGVADPPASALDENPTPLDAGMANHLEVLDEADRAAKDVQLIFEATINQL
ncbi:hypothetical protein BABINDRAFT_159892 [Babjeviella inositovora NRRL Y-12698]|uniref:Purine nucleoside phosphorylase n=1 Tax=Babjeviella inositovora NRRL Y-12698 TaxID=984486 RepID=A0A1E3QVD4_9ASCO|nr:uncharacterized protein BABINDRAFT_159892 [Babjeviella inositovora NRRL Y-12698]ODQ81625.1 hypothetical protein BABINDRAFT_159892 [Babjeviella inositovora NRRL Y-12698]